MISTKTGTEPVSIQPPSGSTARSAEEDQFRALADRQITAARQGLAKPPDPRIALQGFLLLDSLTRLFIWAGSFASATATMSALDAWPAVSMVGGDLGAAWSWAAALVKWIVLFNLSYVAELVVLRLPIPRPKPGLYLTNKPLNLLNAVDRQLLYSCLIALLTKARYEAPFPAFLVFHVSNLPPMRWLMGPIFGPKSKSCYVTDPVILDPHLVEIGRNVVLGSGCNVAGHCQLPDMVSIRKTIIEDDVVIGANSTVFGGVHIRRGAMIGAGSVVSPFTVVGQCEYWAGVPAVKVRDLPPPPYFTPTKHAAKAGSPNA